MSHKDNRLTHGVMDSLRRALGVSGPDRDARIPTYSVRGWVIHGRGESVVRPGTYHTVPEVSPERRSSAASSCVPCERRQARGPSDDPPPPLDIGGGRRSWRGVRCDGGARTTPSRRRRSDARGVDQRRSSRGLPQRGAGHPLRRLRPAEPPDFQLSPKLPSRASASACRRREPCRPGRSETPGAADAEPILRRSGGGWPLSACIPPCAARRSCS